MADLVNYSVQLSGGAVRVYGQVVDSDDQNIQLATFGQNGQAFITWYNSLTNDQQIKFVKERASSIMVDMLLGKPY
jgi:hypothetical protein